MKNPGQDFLSGSVKARYPTEGTGLDVMINMIIMMAVLLIFTIDNNSLMINIISINISILNNPRTMLVQPYNQSDEMKQTVMLSRLTFREISFRHVHYFI